MKKLLLITAVLLSTFLTSCSVEEDINTPEEYNTETINVEYTQMDYDIAELINEHRISKRLLKKRFLTARIWLKKASQVTTFFMYVLRI